MKEDLVDRVAKSLDQCEFARFAPAVGSVQMDGMYKEAVDLISTMEDSIR